MNKKFTRNGDDDEDDEFSSPKKVQYYKREIERVGQLMDVLTPLCGKDMRKVPTYISFEVLNQIVAHFGGIMQAKN